MKRCGMCKIEKPLDAFNKKRMNADGRQNECRECINAYNRQFNDYFNAQQMYVNGKYVSKKHPLYKPGRYKTLGEAWSDVELNNKTKEGHVYIIYNHNFGGWFKVGCAVDAEDRLRDYQTYSPFRDYCLAYYERFDDRFDAERRIHDYLKESRYLVQYCNEWFMIDPYHIKKAFYAVRLENEMQDHTGHRDQLSPQYDLGLRY